MKKNSIVTNRIRMNAAKKSAYFRIAGIVVLLAVIVNVAAFSIDFSKLMDAVGKRCIVTIQKVISPALAYYGDIEHGHTMDGIGYVRKQLFPAADYIEDNLFALNTQKKNDEFFAEKDEDKSYEEETKQPETIIAAENGSEDKTADNKTDNETASGGNVVHFKAKEEETAPEQNPLIMAVTSRNVITGQVYPKQQLENYSFLLGNFYTVTNATELTSAILKPKAFLEKDLSLKKKDGMAQILIFHTHSQEGFADSIPGNTSTTIVGVGDYLAAILHDKYGYNVYHDTTVYDLVNGKLDRSAAYTYAEENVAKILKENPGIEVVIDLHRDGVDENVRLVTDINGKHTAKIMFFNGLSYSKINKDIAYLPNPNRDANLAMSLQMQLLGNAYYPGFLRKIYINSYRYVLHLKERSMLIEAGAQNNTVAEVKNAMEPLADILDKLLRGEKAY